MKSIVLVVPYFGRLPDFFPVWKQTARANPTVDFLFFTDIDALRDEGNIKTIHLPLDKLKEKFQKNFEFDISIKAPYKFCDFRPAYGQVLHDYLQGYDFWGHCDIDLVFGDIRRFLTDDILERHQKILEHGHLTLYRNDEETNTVFLRETGYKDYGYRKAFTSDESLYFDEFLGSQLIFRRERIPTYLNPDIFFQVDPSERDFCYASQKLYHVIFRHRDGKLYMVRKVDGTLLREEILYTHFLKRTIRTDAFRPGEDFDVIPNRIAVGNDERDYDRWLAPSGSRLYRLHRKYLHVREYLKRYAAGDYPSFAEYRRQRKCFREDLWQAKCLLREYGDRP